MSEKMREEFESWYADQIWGNECWEDRLYIAWKASRAQADAEIAKRDTLIAMQAEALTKASALFSRRGFNEAASEMEKALSASAESVAAWEAKNLEPLQRQMAMLRELLYRWLSTYARRASLTIEGTSEVIRTKDALTNTQATAEAYDREHAAKVLEELKRQAVPEGWQLLPKHSPIVKIELWDGKFWQPEGSSNYNRMLEAMLAATPQPEGVDK